LRLRNRSLTGLGPVDPQLSWLEIITMLDIVYLALGAGILLALGLYARALARL
jgi:hypothetical protein